MGSLTKSRGRPGGRYRVVFVDLDGTLIPATSVSMFLGARLGHSELLRDLERLFLEHTISNKEIAERSAPAYRGKALVEIADLLSEIPMISGVEGFVSRLKRSEIRVVLCTITWHFAARAFQRRYGFDACCGTEMQERDGVLTGLVSRHFNELDKLQFARDYCAINDVAMEQCAAIGDSRSDIPLFQHVGLAIAFNGSEAARYAAHVSVDSQDICDVLK